MVANMATTSLNVAGSRFAPVAGLDIFSFSSGSVTISGGGVTDPTTNVTLSTLNHLTPILPDPNSLRCTLNAKTGAFAGSFIAPGEKARTPFAGVVFTKNPMAIGQFKGNAGSGTVLLAP
jgi:hypothetical protein